jgi:DNA-binding winged helix-turn-helix (wHTH) protein/serine/threonine protein kinase/tetratricopeptide (TPR) repeat protein
MIPNDSQVGVMESSGRLWRFADCEFDDLALQLRAKGNAVCLELKPLEVLLQLLLRAGEVVSKDDLLDAVWPGLSVVDGSLATAISKLRRALGDQHSSIVITVPRVGYRLGVPVQYRPLEPRSSARAAMMSAGDAVPGRDQWRLIMQLDPAGNHDVWLAEHPKTHEKRVFKFAWDASRLRSLKREVTVARFLRETLGERSDFVRLLEWNLDRPPHFIESEYAGVELSQWPGGIEGVPLDTRLQIFVDVATAVADAHDAGVLHKDLKPANILVTATGDLPEVRVADFGSASLMEPAKLKALGITNLGFTQTLHPHNEPLTGTLMYLAPEILTGKAPTARSDVYALGVILYQIVIGDFRKPLSPGWESDIEDPLLREDIAQAAHGDPGRRLARARDLVQRVVNLDRRRAEREAAERAKLKEEIAMRRKAVVLARLPWVVFAVLAVVVTMVAILPFLRRPPAAQQHLASVAVLPFQNVSGNSSLDYLSYALPDEITTTLSRTRPLTIRPFSAASKYRDPVTELQKVGHELAANRIVTGRYLVLGEQLQITMEAVDVDTNRMVWRDTVNVPAKDSLALQAQLAASARGSLARALGATAAVRGSLSRPKIPEAYDLFLRQLYLSGDPEPNRKGLEMLQRAVELDPTYARAWVSLSNRMYAASRFGGGSDTMLQRSDAAAERALAEDPDSIDAINEMAIHHTERGELVKAYQQAQAMVRRKPDDAVSHHALGYVLRYAGLLNEAAEECETARMLEPEVKWSSCSSTFMELGDYHRARDYFREELTTGWSKAHAIEILVRQGRGEEALKVGSPNIPDWESYNMLLACAQHKPAEEIRALAEKVKASTDPEVTYFFAGHLAYCGQTEASLEMLKMAILGKHCSYPAMDNDPLFASVRETPRWNQLHDAGMQCQKEFLANRGQ